MNIPKQLSYTPSDDDRQNIESIAEKYPHAVQNAQDAIKLSLRLVATAIVFEPNRSERIALSQMVERVPGIQGDDVRAIGWALAEWKTQRDGGHGRREMTERILTLVEAIAEKLEVEP